MRDEQRRQGRNEGKQTEGEEEQQVSRKKNLINKRWKTLDRCGEPMAEPMKQGNVQRALSSSARPAVAVGAGPPEK